MRKFEEVKEEFKKFPEVETQLPERGTAHSAGYDFKSKEKVTLWPGDHHTFWTDVKARYYFDNVLFLYTRSGNGCKKGLVLRNNTGVIDPDFADNETNDGNIGICLVNQGTDPVFIEVGDKIAQGVFVKFYITDDDKYIVNKEENKEKRTGGFGSTGK